MKTNALVTEIIRGKWVLEMSAVPHFEKLANDFLKGNFKGTEINRKEFFASVDSSGTSSMNNGEVKDQKRVVVLPITGIIPAYGDMCMLGADDYLDILRRLNNDDSIGAIVINGDGPGSSLDAINAFKTFKLEKKKPIVGLFNSCYSGYYWMKSLLCDYTYANFDVSSGFGSIGTLAMVMDSREAMKKEGYKVMVVRAPQSTDKAQQMVDFVEGNDEAFITSLSEEMREPTDKFIADVKAGNPRIKDVPGMFSGATFSATKAVEYGMIDAIGNERMAIEKAMMLATLNSN